METQNETETEVIPEQIDAQVVAKVDEANELSMTVSNIKITNDQERVASIKFLHEVKAVYKALDIERRSLTDPIQSMKDKIMKFFKTPLETLKGAEGYLKQAVGEFEDEQERIRQQAMEKARLKALAEENRKRKVLMERAEREASKGNTEKAELLNEKAESVYVPAQVAAPALQKVAGHSTRKNWKHRVIDEAKVPDEYKVVNDKMLAQVAKAHQGKLKVAGVEFYQETITSARVASAKY